MPMSEPIELEAAPMPELVLALMTAASDDEAVPIVVLVFEFMAVWLAVIAEPSDEVAVWTSDSVAREPDERPAPVSVLVPFAHTSEARVPNVVRERVPAAQTALGIPVTDDAIEVRVEPSDVDAFNTCAFVFALITVASDVDAVVTVPESVAICEFVFPFTTVATEEVALCTSDNVASDPLESPAPVSVLVPFVHTSAASVPKVVSERVPDAHTAAGIPVTEVASTDRVEPSDVEAVSTCRLVFAFITVASDVEAVPTMELVFAFTAVWLALIAELSDELAVCTSESVAREPEVRPAPVRVRVP